MYSVISTSEISKKEWGKFVYENSRGNVFQTPEMYEVYKNTKNYEPVFVGISDSRGEIVGILLSVIQWEFGGPLKILSSRCVTWGGPLISDSLSEEERKKVLSLILREQNKKVRRKALYMEFRNLWDLKKYNDFFRRFKFRYENHLNIILDLTGGKEEIFKHMRSSKRRAIRKALKDGVKIKIAENINDVKKIYLLLLELYAERIQKPLPDFSFFKSIFEILQSNNMGRVFLIIYESKVIGGIVTPHYKETIYELYIVGSQKYKKMYPSEMATWAPIEWGIKNGYRFFDFMGAGRPGEKYGVRDFKLGFGGELVEYGRYKNIYHNTMYNISLKYLCFIKKVKK